MKITVESTDGSVSGEYENLAIATIKTGLQQLNYFKRIGSSPKPDELDWEIKLYEWILGQPDAEEKASAYLSARHVGKEEGFILEKRDVVKKLGWVI